jgi:hypothetical protein
MKTCRHGIRRRGTVGAVYTAAEIEQRSGVPVELLIRFRRLLGLPQPEAAPLVEVALSLVEAAESAEPLALYRARRLPATPRAADRRRTRASN